MSRNLNNVPLDKRKKLPEIKGGGHNRNRFVQKPKDIKNTLKRLNKYISVFKGIIIFLIIGVILVTGLTTTGNVFIKNIVKSMGSYDFINHEWIVAPDKHAFFVSALFLCGGFLVISILNFLTNLFANILAVKVVRKMRNDLFAKVVRLPIKYTDTHAHGDLMSRMTNDVSNITDMICSSLTSIVSGIVQLLGCLGLMLWYSPLLTLVTFITLIISLIVSRLISSKMKPLFKKQQILLGNVNTQTEEMVTGIKTVSAYNHQDEAIEEFNLYSDELKKTGCKANIISSTLWPIMNALGNINYFFVCFFGAIFVINGIGKTLIGNPIDISVIALFLLTSKQFTQPINQIAQMYASILSAIAGAERVFEILDEKTEDFTGQEELGDVSGTIEFKDVNFSYVEDKPVIKDYSLEVRSGHKIALVGATGSGKTTIVNLLMRFYDIDSGEILVDGKNINLVSKKELRDNIGIVLQDAVLFEDTIENNIRYGRRDATKEELDRAIDMANCRKFINRLPEKEQTILTEGASNISQGQRQLLTIARAILADPKILILDEATSSVDTRTEKKIQDAMVNLMENRTSIIIAHRLSTIQDADLIVVMNDGKVVEMGNHNELLKAKGVYSKLYQTQFSGLNT